MNAFLALPNYAQAPESIAEINEPLSETIRSTALTTTPATRGGGILDSVRMTTDDIDTFTPINTPTRVGSHSPHVPYRLHRSLTWIERLAAGLRLKVNLVVFVELQTDGLGLGDAGRAI